MEWIRDILAVMGGAGVIVIGLSKLLGGIWRDRLKEQARKNAEMDLETHKQLLSIRRIQTDRFVNSQYEVYIELWQTLQGMKLAVELLWEDASPQNVVTLASSLRKTREHVDNWSLFFEEGDFADLDRLLKIIEDFHAGKAELVRIRSTESLQKHVIEDIKRQIDQNKKYKEQFEVLLSQIRSSFKTQISRIDENAKEMRYAN